MANTPKKVKDPTEVALSAIQEALNIDGSASDIRGSARSDAEPEMTATPPSFDEPSFDARPINDRTTFTPVEETRVTRRAANDDRETIGQLLQAIQKGRPARSAFTLAILASAVWFIGAAILTIGFWPSIQGSGATLTLAGLLALFVAPILMFFYMALLSSRGKELQMIAQSMAQVAVRFSDP